MTHRIKDIHRQFPPPTSPRKRRAYDAWLGGVLDGVVSIEGGPPTIPESRINIKGPSMKRRKHHYKSKHSIYKDAEDESGREPLRCRFGFRCYNGDDSSWESCQ